MTPLHPLVVVVDDDASVREALPHLIVALGFSVRTFASGEAFLASGCAAETRCLIADIAMPGMSGLELRRALIHEGYDLPTILMTARADDALRKQLMGSGAPELLCKPFPEDALLAAIEEALKRVC